MRDGGLRTRTSSARLGRSGVRVDSHIGPWQCGVHAAGRRENGKPESHRKSRTNIRTFQAGHIFERSEKLHRTQRYSPFASKDDGASCAEGYAVVKRNYSFIMNNNYYVYVYIDPRNYEEFYYGKGKGNRMKAHLNDESDTEKVKRIKAIQKEGLEPIIKVIAKGLTESEAFLIEKTLIWKLGRNLTNILPGHFADKFRPHNTLHLNLIVLILRTEFFM